MQISFFREIFQFEESTSCFKDLNHMIDLRPALFLINLLQVCLLQQKQSSLEFVKSVKVSGDQLRHREHGRDHNLFFIHFAYLCISKVSWRVSR